MSQKKKVLIIDDEVDLCTLMKRYYLRKGYQVAIAHTLQAAFQHIEEEKPTKILLDGSLCTDPYMDIARIKEAAPDAELILSKAE